MIECQSFVGADGWNTSPSFGTLSKAWWRWAPVNYLVTHWASRCAHPSESAKEKSRRSLPIARRLLSTIGLLDSNNKIKKSKSFIWRSPRSQKAILSLPQLSRTCTELPERTVLCRFAHVRSAESRCEADRQGGTEVMRSGTALINEATGRQVVEHSIKSSILRTHKHRLRC